MFGACLGTFLLMASNPALANSSASVDIAAPLRAAQAAKQGTQGSEDEQFGKLFRSWQAFEEAGSASLASVSSVSSGFGASRQFGASVSVPSLVPLKGVHLTSGFGMRSHPVLGGRRSHKGVDPRRTYGHSDSRCRRRHHQPCRLVQQLRPVRLHRTWRRDSDPLCPHVTPQCGQGPACQERRRDRLCGIDRPLDRPAPALRGPHQQGSGQSAALHADRPCIAGAASRANPARAVPNRTRPDRHRGSRQASIFPPNTQALDRAAQTRCYTLQG